MNKRKLTMTFNKIKAASKMDYAITTTDDYGDCNSCVNAALGTAFGMESKGIFIKVWQKGMNKGKSWNDLKCVYVAHDITEEQADMMIKVFEENGYNIEPKIYDPCKCFVISEKENNNE